MASIMTNFPILTKEKQNCIRISKICSDFFKQPLADILASEIQPVDLYNKIQHSCILSIGKEGLSSTQMTICFLSPPAIPDYSNFDVTLLYTLIRNLCPSLEPTKGWGKDPVDTDTEIGDDIERVRFFRGKIPLVHSVSSNISDNDFEMILEELKSILQRIQNHMISKGYNVNYEEKMTNIKQLDLGDESLYNYMIDELLEYHLDSLKQPDDKERPMISITGPRYLLCGITAEFIAVTNPENLEGWSVEWRKHLKCTQTRINSNTEKYHGSTEKNLVIQAVCKEDEGGYQAILSKVSKGNTELYVSSNVIFLQAIGELPIFDVWNVTTKMKEIRINYAIQNRLPEVNEIKWCKDGVPILNRNRKYNGGKLNDNYFTITSPTIEDRGNYSCVVKNAVGSVQKDIRFDVPNADISTEQQIYVGSETMLLPRIVSCPSPDGVQWQQSNDGTTFNSIDISQPKYSGSSCNPNSPLLMIPKVTLEDKLYYRLLVWNKIGEQYSNTIFLNVKYSPPNITISHGTSVSNRSVTLIGNVFLYGSLPVVKNVFWTKNEEVLDTKGSGGRYSEVTVDNPSLTIFEINEYDAGSYQLTATNDAGSTTSDFLILDVPDVSFARPEKKNNGSFWVPVTVQAIPAPNFVRWSIKENTCDAFVPIDENLEEFKGTSNTLPHPVLVVQPSNDLKNYCFQIEVHNFIGSCKKILLGQEINETVASEIFNDGTQKEKDAYYKPIHSLNLKRLFGSIDSDLQVKPSTTSFAHDILNVVEIDKIRSEVNSLSNEIVLNMISNATLDDNKQGNVYFAEVTVVCEKNGLVVKKKNENQWMDFLRINKDNIIRLILINSRYLRVIEAKHSVYREFQSDIASGKIYLQHVIEDYDEIAKVSAWKKLSWFTDMVELIIDRFPFEQLSEILSEAANLVFNKINITRLCLSVHINDDKKQARSTDDTNQFRTILVKDTMQKIGEALGYEIFYNILQSCIIKEEERFRLHFEVRISDLLPKSLISTVVSTFNLMFCSWASFPATEDMLCDANSEECRREIAREIHELVCESKEIILLRLLEQIKPMSETTLMELHSLSKSLRKIENELQITDLKEVVKTWEQRELILSRNGPDKHPSVLKVIAGCKDNKPTVKVFLNHNDEEAMKIFNDSDQIPKGTHFEFVNVADVSTEIFRGKEKSDHTSVNKSVRECLGQIIKNQGENMYAIYSTIVGLGIGTMDSNGSIQPCIIIYCLDKHLVPYGEKELPKSIEGWNCDMREDYVIFGSCFDCRIITNPNPGCCIGLHEPPNGSGSVGFLVKENDSTPERAGFLTAAHVAADNWRDLYYSNSLLSTLDGFPFEYRIVHPLPPTQNVSRVIGRVKDLFCGNWGPEGTGIDAAFVENDEPRRGDIKKLQIADGRNLRFDRSIKVFKRGGTTGETEGYLSDNSLSVCLDFTNGFYFFDRCYAVTSINSPFFEPGDSGSGVFLIENGVPTKPLGIAFAFHKRSQTTAVCRIDKIIDAFNLSVYQYEEESMET